MYKLTIEHDAQNDINLMLSSGEEEKKFAAIILAFLSQLKADQKLLGELLTHKFENDKFSVSRVQCIWGNQDVWRLKTFEWNLSRNRRFAVPYRIIYAYESKTLTFRVLAIAYRRHKEDTRSYNYEPDHPITQRILKAYRELGLPIYKYNFPGKYKQ